MSNMTYPTTAEMASIAAENTQLRTDLTRAETALTGLRHRIGDLAAEAAREHDWCGVARELVDEIGGIWPEPTPVDFTITKTWTITATPNDQTDPDDSQNEAYIEDTLTIDTPTLGHEWADWTVTDESTTTVHVH